MCPESVISLLSAMKPTAVEQAAFSEDTLPPAGPHGRAAATSCPYMSFQFDFGLNDNCPLSCHRILV